MEGGGTSAAFQIPQCDSCDKPALVEQAYSGRILCVRIGDIKLGNLPLGQWRFLKK